MRLLTQNILKCNVNKCSKLDLPLDLIVEKSEIIEAEQQDELLRTVVRRLNWAHLAKTVGALGESLPDQLTEDMLTDKTILAKLHNILFQVHVTEGKLVCGECKRLFPIKNGIPNLLLDDHEV